MVWDVLPNTTYLPDFVNNRNVADPVQVMLASGLHTVTVFLRQDATRLDTIELVPVVQAATQNTVIASHPYEGDDTESVIPTAEGVGGHIHLATQRIKEDVNFSDFYLTLQDAETQGATYNQRIQADRIGNYRFDGLPPGADILKLEVPAGFETSTSEVRIVLSAMQLGEVSFDVAETTSGNSQKLFLPLVNR